MSGVPESKVDWFFTSIYGLSYGDLREIASRLAPHMVARLCEREATREDERDLIDVLYDTSEEWVYTKGEEPQAGRVLEMRSYD
ncbi:MAG: hypothetical protein ACLFV8_08400 [Alphaproteobacteria bacterium]